MMTNILSANWSAPNHIIAGVTLRSDGVSHFVEGDECSNNLALHVNDNAANVMRNRQALADALDLPTEQFQWLNQVHGAAVHIAKQASLACVPDADAVISRQQGVVCCVMTADCLPILLTNKQGTEVAAIHAGWRSLAGGIVENTAAAMHSDAAELMAWFGPAISAKAFEVGQDVYQAFVSKQAIAGDAFTQYEDKYLADLPLLARQRLAAIGVTLVDDSAACTVLEPERWFSYRRDGQTGRMASFIAIK